MAEYRLLIKPSAAKEIDAIGSRRDRRRIIARIAALSEEPRPLGSEKLAGSESRYRVRQGNYRVVYAVDDAARVVEVVKVGHRREVYRKGTQLPPLWDPHKYRANISQASSGWYDFIEGFDGREQVRQSC